MTEIRTASPEELVAELKRRGLLPRCRCKRWQTYLGAWDRDGYTVPLPRLPQIDLGMYLLMEERTGKAATANDTWVRSYESDGEYLEHLDGVDWFDAPPPPRWHKCVAQTRGWMLGGFIERCACGGARLHRPGPWLDRNERIHQPFIARWRKWARRD